MKKGILWLLLAALLLSGCGAGRVDAHPEWDAAWIRFDNHLAAETPDGFVPGEYNDTLSISGIFYNTWTAGEGRSITNAEGEEATAFEAQLYLLLTEEKSEKEARSSVAKWIAREKQSYQAGTKEEWTVGDQDYQVFPLEKAKTDNPYSHGAAAFAVRGSSAISVELLCSDRFVGDAEAVLKGFLESVHFGEN